MSRLWRIATCVVLIGLHALALGFPLLALCPDEVACEESEEANCAGCTLCVCCLDRSPAYKPTNSALIVGAPVLDMPVLAEIVPALPEPKDILHVPKLHLA